MLRRVLLGRVCGGEFATAAAGVRGQEMVRKKGRG